MLAYASEHGMEVVEQGQLTSLEATWTEVGGVWMFATIDGVQHPLGMLLLAN
jgi:hypothetical protein